MGNHWMNAVGRNGLIILALLAPPALADVIYVDDDATHDPGPGDPTISDLAENGTLEHPYDAIQEALIAALPGDEVVVLDGVYTGAGNVAIWLPPDIHLRSHHGPQHCIIELAGLDSGVSFSGDATAATCLEGFTIQNGTRGVSCGSGNPVIRDCIIKGNVTGGHYGGGIRCWQGSPTIVRCIITGNFVGDGGGGGIQVDGGADQCVTIANCVISNNTAAEEGGGIHINCDGVVTIRDCLIEGNVATRRGGGVHFQGLDHVGTVLVQNCTVVNNIARIEEPGDWSCGGGLHVSGANPVSRSIANCILWGNTSTYNPQACVWSDAAYDFVAYCDIQDDQPLGPSYHEIITADPLFVDPDNHDNHDFHLSADSPCIDAGDPDFEPAVDEADLDLQERVFADRVDIGADEFYPFTDCNHNGAPDEDDIAGGTSPDCNDNQIPDECEPADCNDNGILDECDLDSGQSLDCNLNGIPDECERDCNENGIPDDCDIAEGTSLDENGNGNPDECDYVTRVFHVDDDALGDPAPGDPDVSDPHEDGSVDHPFDAIQEAIDASNSGDEIVVLDGRYTGTGNKTIHFDGRAVHLHSLGGPQLCTIDCQGDGLAFFLYQYETPATRIEGFTIRNGWSEYDAGAIDLLGSSPTIHNCLITQNTSVYYSAVHLSHSNAVVSNCRITHNDGSISGGGAITCSTGAPIISNCLILGNIATWCAGIAAYNDAAPAISNCTIVGNSSRYYGAGVYCNNSSPNLRNCIIWDNESPSDLAVYLSEAAYPQVDFCAVDGQLPAGVIDGGHNIHLDPRLLNAETEHIGALSACIDAGDPDFIPADGESDLDGQPRQLGERVDIGADEYDAFDCNYNGVPDDEDIAGGSSADCDADGVPDECQLGGTTDCNQNGTPDLCDIFTGASYDCNDDALPDECEPAGDQDCDDDGVSDLCEIHLGSPDRNINLVPDECEPHLTIHVNDDAPGDPGPGDPLLSDPDEDGTAAHPYDAIQEALDAAPSGESELVTVLVADGLYNGIGNRDLDCGGKILTLRSINGPQACIIDCQEAGRGFNFQNGETPATVLEGFTIQNGLSDAGGGIRCSNSTPLISNCTIVNNSATESWGSGGGVYFWNRKQHAQIIRDCHIISNTARRGGGGIYSAEGTGLVLGCVIAGNTCTDAYSISGAGVYADSSYGNLTIADCLIVGNVSLEAHGSNNSSGAGIGNRGDMLAVSNCTITGNYAGDEGGSGGGVYSTGSTVVRNSIIRDNLPAGFDIGFRPEIVPVAAFCNITNGVPPGAIDGGGNIDADPVFADPNGPDNDPQTWDDNDYRLAAGSPCIDAANNAAVPADLPDLDLDGDIDEPLPFDLDGYARFVDDPDTPDSGIGDPPIVDMGAYEFQIIVPGDLNCDGLVDLDDVNPFVLALGGQAGYEGQYPHCHWLNADCDSDGHVDFDDIDAFVAILNGG